MQEVGYSGIFSPWPGSPAGTFVFPFELTSLLLLSRHYRGLRIIFYIYSAHSSASARKLVRFCFIFIIRVGNSLLFFPLRKYSLN